ncbi:MAG: TIGR01440 family protein [Bacillota bacterium]
MLDLELLRAQTKEVFEEIFAIAALQAGAVLAIGCSTSAILGKKIGSAGSTDIAQLIYPIIAGLAAEHQVNIVFQCCEHLNRAVVIDRKIALVQHLEIVSAVPKPKAGGALASLAFQSMVDPVVVEFAKADAGIDIGGVLIGMHIRHVAVPLKLEHHYIGEARIIAAKSRPKLIGGERAEYL